MVLIKRPFFVKFLFDEQSLQILNGEFHLIAYSISFTKSKLCDRSFLLGKKNQVIDNYRLESHLLYRSVLEELTAKC